MKQAYIWVAFVLLLVLNIVLMMRLSHANKRIDMMVASRQEAPNLGGHQAHEDDEEIELAVVMSHIQRHANKLYFAGQNENWPLAAFYVHELEESMEEVEDGHIEEDGINISKLMKSIGLPALKTMEEAVEGKNKAAFTSAYTNLVSNCNTCHQSAAHPYIVIINPTTPALDNQQY
jgi:hypothetical protein